MKNNLGFIMNSFINGDDHWTEETVRRNFPTTVAPESLNLGQHAATEIQAFADIFEIPAEEVLNHAVMFWFDSTGADSILRKERIREWLAADPRRTRAGYWRKQDREQRQRRKQAQAAA